MRGSVALGINYIVLLIFALLVMGLILGWTFVKFKDSSDQLRVEHETIQASSSNPLTIPSPSNTLFLSKSKENLIEFGVYNKGEVRFASELILVCNPEVAYTLSVVDKEIQSGESAMIAASLTFGSEETFGKKNCQLSFGEESRTLFIELK